jgi:hypothetical protein
MSATIATVAASNDRLSVKFTGSVRAASKFGARRVAVTHEPLGQLRRP